MNEGNACLVFVVVSLVEKRPRLKVETCNCKISVILRKLSQACDCLLYFVKKMQVNHS